MRAALDDAGAMAQGAAQAWGHAKFSVINDDERLAGLTLPELMVIEKCALCSFPRYGACAPRVHANGRLSADMLANQTCLIHYAHQGAFLRGQVTRQSLIIAPDSGIETWTQVSSLPDILLLLEYSG